MGRFTLLFCTLAAMSLAACRAGGFENENDRLRALVLDLKDEAADLRRRASELESALSAASVAPADVDPDVLASTPRVAELGISRLSHVRRDDGDRLTLVLYLVPADGRGRFLQLAGHLAVHAAVLPAGREAITIGDASMDPVELRAAYRSGVTGTHYTIEIPITPPDDETLHTCAVRAVFTDGWTGRRHEANGTVSLRPSV